MTSKTSSANWGREMRQTYLWSLKKCRGMTALMAVLLFLGFPAILLFALANANIRTDGLTLNAYGIPQQYEMAFIDVKRYTMVLTIAPLCALFAILFAVLLFRYMHNKRSTDLFHSLPVRRSAMLVGRLLAGLTSLAVPLVCNTCIAAAITLCFDVQDKGGHIADLFLQMLGMLLVVAAAFLFCILMAVCTGTTLDMVLSVIGVNLAFPILVYSCIYMISRLLPGFGSWPEIDETILVGLSPFAALFISPFTLRNSLNATTFFAWWVIFTVFLTFLCIYLYRRRKSEAAENTFAFQIPKGLIRFLITAVGGFALGFILFWYYASTVNFLVGMLLGSVVAHIVVEAIYSRGFSHMKRSFVGYAVFAGAFLVFYGVVCTGAFGYAERIPNADEIESIRFKDTTYYQNFGSDSFRIYGEQNENLVSVEPELREPENVEKVLAFHRAIMEYKKAFGFPYRMQEPDGTRCQIEYRLKNGKTFVREYYMYDRNQDEEIPVSLQEISTEIVNSEEYKTSGNLLFYVEPEDLGEVEVKHYDQDQSTISETYRLNDSQKTELLEALRQDTLETDITGREAAQAVPESTVKPEQPADAIEVVCGTDGLFEPKSGSKLKTLLGDYDGKIRAQAMMYYLGSLENSRTEQFLVKQGWLSEES